jgi:hypothetical protein
MAGEDGHDHINDAALVAKVSEPLLSQACQRINFRWGKLHVTGKAYRAVVRALNDSRIDIFEADGAEHTLDPDAEASYIGNPESMIIQPHLNAHIAFNQRVLVHEATHAAQDDQLNGEWVWSLDDEATAYIAEWLFVIYSSPNPKHLISNPDPDDPIEVIALEIARALADHPGASPDPAAMRRLGDAIFKDPTYSVRMALHPWTRDDGVTDPDFP